MKTATKVVQLVLFTIAQIVKFHTDNVRIVTNDFPSMWYDIAENGLKDAPLINMGKDFHTMIKGHRRRGALLWGYENERETFDKVFPEGNIPFEVLKGLSDFEIVMRRNDHGNVRSLVKGEVLKSMGQLFGQNYSERQVILANLAQMELVAKPESGKKGAKAITLRQEAEGEKNPERRAKLLKESSRLSCLHYHGFAGTAKQLFLLRETPAGPTAINQYCGLEVKVPLKLDQIQKLASLLVEDWKADSKIDKKTNFGTTSLAYWQELVKKSKEPKPAKATREAKPDMLTRKQSEEREMLFTSQACKLGFKASRGEKVPEGPAIDKLAALVEKAFACVPEEVTSFLQSVIDDFEAENAPTVDATADAEVEATA